MLSRADDLATMTVLDGTGDPVKLGTLWRDKPAALVFVRHFGCIHCRQHIIEINRDIDKIHAAGGELHVIGNGSPSFIEGYRDETRWSGPIYTDPSLAVYKAAELKRGVTTVLDPRALAPTLKAFLRGGRQGRTQGDQWQQGGSLVIGTDGTVLWHHVSDRPGDNAPASEIVAALR
jgi:peroxiredoxin